MPLSPRASDQAEPVFRLRLQCREHLDRSWRSTTRVLHFTFMGPERQREAYDVFLIRQYGNTEVFTRYEAA